MRVRVLVRCVRDGGLGVCVCLCAVWGRGVCYACACACALCAGRGAMRVRVLVRARVRVWCYAWRATGGVACPAVALCVLQLALSACIHSACSSALSHESTYLRRQTV